MNDLVADILRLAWKRCILCLFGNHAVKTGGINVRARGHKNHKLWTQPKMSKRKGGKTNRRPDNRNGDMGDRY